MQIYRGNIISTYTLCKVSSSILERKNRTPRIGDIWTPKLYTSPNHFTRFYVLSIRDLFHIRDRILRVEHIGVRSHVIIWRMWWDSKQRWQCQLESTNEQNFSLLPSNILPLKPIRKGDQFDFLDWCLKLYITALKSKNHVMSYKIWSRVIEFDDIGFLKELIIESLIIRVIGLASLKIVKGGTMRMSMNGQKN